MDSSHVEYQDPIKQIQKSYENILKSKNKQQGRITERITQSVLYPKMGLGD